MPTPVWHVDDSILFRDKAEPFDHFAVKDPTIVFRCSSSNRRACSTC